VFEYENVMKMSMLRVKGQGRSPGTKTGFGAPITPGSDGTVPSAACSALHCVFNRGFACGLCLVTCLVLYMQLGLLITR